MQKMKLAEGVDLARELAYEAVRPNRRIIFVIPAVGSAEVRAVHDNTTDLLHALRNARLPVASVQHQLVKLVNGSSILVVGQRQAEYRVRGMLADAVFMPQGVTPETEQAVLPTLVEGKGIAVYY